MRGDALVNLSSTSAMPWSRVGWRGAAGLSQMWCRLARVGALSLHGKEGVDGSSPSEAFIGPALFANRTVPRRGWLSVDQVAQTRIVPRLAD
jgi:hypothetical protein